MQDVSIAHQFENVHFPRQINLIKRLRVTSFIINDITLLVSFLALAIWIIDIPGIKIFLFQQLALHPLTPILFIFSSIPLLFGAKRHLIDTHHDAEKEKRPLWLFGAPIFFAFATAFLVSLML